MSAAPAPLRAATVAGAILAVLFIILSAVVGGINVWRTHSAANYDEQAAQAQSDKAALDQQIAEANGAELLFGMFAEQLITDDSGRVTGAYVHDKGGDYTQIDASKGVILCCGDISGNPEMLDYYVPWVEGIAPFYPNLDVKGDVANTGDGHRMGMWAGGHMEKGPLAPMTHHMGAALGVDAFL